MIGVVINPSERQTVEEFFQLFKTPWEFFEDGRFYDVVLTTVDVPKTDARLVLVYSSTETSGDGSLNLVCESRLRNRMVAFDTSELPIYGDLLTFGRNGIGLVRLSGGAENVGVKLELSGKTVCRFGYDLFEEVAQLLTIGQPAEHARYPTLDLHIELLRKCILDSGLGLIEIPPVPAGYRFIACLTHDIDFVGIRRHLFDHTMWGFLYRATAGSILNFVRGRMSPGQVVRNLKAVVSLPFVYLGLAKDFWSPFDWYLREENGIRATYFFIPFKNRAGTDASGRPCLRRGVSYDISEVAEWVARLREAGHEIGVHGIDAWRSKVEAREELARVKSIGGEGPKGIRMHWLLKDENTFRVLDEAGYAYDSTGGYNGEVGYLHGTSQVFRPPGCRELMELPMQIQDGAMFYRKRLDLSEEEASQICGRLVQRALAHGGVLTVIWHDRSHAPERWWGGFYRGLIQQFQSEKAWFASGSEAVKWFTERRNVRFERAGAERERAFGSSGGAAGDEHPVPPLVMRVWEPKGRVPHGRSGGRPDFTDQVWAGKGEFEPGIAAAGEFGVKCPKQRPNLPEGLPMRVAGTAL